MSNPTNDQTIAMSPWARTVRWLLGWRRRLSALDYLRALAVLGFLLFAFNTTAGWCKTHVFQPFRDGRMKGRDLYQVSAIEKDLSLVRRSLPATGTVGYLSEKWEGRRYELRYLLAPLLLDFDWTKHELVLVDYPMGNRKSPQFLPNYRLITDFRGASSFARDMKLFRRKP
jgi:hypothetical protein